MKSSVTPSHLILHVADTQATLDFWCAGLEGVLESDEILEAPALDAMFGRSGVRIRDTFVRVGSGKDTGGIRLHTIETLDVRRTHASAAPGPQALGLGGVSFLVADIAAAHERAAGRGLAPTEIYTFGGVDPAVKMFFLEDPDGVRVEMMASSDDPSDLESRREEP